MSLRFAAREKVWSFLEQRDAFQWAENDLGYSLCFSVGGSELVVVNTSESSLSSTEKDFEKQT